ncbi:SPRY-domain-containing protein [Laetiporus sulphureus 93-53]|uniref:SPRY-domain-containing protein n=1 Tax=Laetiporus sulphureus 93-53 TaxID=1314785 RepID=A0A165FFZ4_9APHY|nr:SPRY-domain-containing protein [Laetiporus sulphureus 93-53]KZT08915.1 SPRY-domain-containing protein [Laetiporus sulphureus 93-53]
MTTRHSRSASIPIPPSSSAARSLEDVFSMPFARQASQGSALVPSVRPRRTSSGVSRSPDERRLRGPSTSPVRSTLSTSSSSTRPVMGSYSSATLLTVRTQRPGAPPSSLANASSDVPTFQPRIIRASSTSNPARDAVCVPTAAATIVPPFPRPRRTAESMRSPTVPTAPRISASLPAGSLLPSPFPRSFPAPHTETSGNAQSFARPAYLEYSALRDFIQTDAPATAPPARGPIAAVHPHAPLPIHTQRAYLSHSTTPVVDSESDGTASPSPPPQLPQPAPESVVSVLPSHPVLRLPTRWSEQDRHTSLTISSDGREVTFCGPSLTIDRDGAAVRANFPIPPACGIYYYEVEILQRGPKGHISVGFSSPAVRLSRLPGWEPNSWGYHADDGYSFSGSRDGSAYGPTFDSGDVIGCGIDFGQNRAFYTKNGAFISMVFNDVPTETLELFPSVGMRHLPESIRVNFGSAPFRFDISNYVRTQRDAKWAGIMRGEMPGAMVSTGAQTHDEESAGEKPVSAAPTAETSESEEETRAILKKLVMGYLEHHGYARTARAFRVQSAKDRGLVGPSERNRMEEAMDTDDAPRASSSTLQYDAPLSFSGLKEIDDFGSVDPETVDLETRLSILQAVRSGDVDTALDALRAHYHHALNAQGGLLLFRLRCRKFVELVLKAGDALRRVKEAEKEKQARPADSAMPIVAVDPMEDMMMDEETLADGEGAMEVDEPSPEALSSSVLNGSSTAVIGTVSKPASAAVLPFTLAEIAKSALHTALSYGQALEADYKTDTRPAVRTHLRRTFGLVAYEDPESVGGEVGAIAGQEARVELAEEVNRAILESQGRPVHPTLETLFCQAGACVVQLGLLGCGAAAFADVRREFLES